LDEALNAAAHCASMHCAGREASGYRCLPTSTVYSAVGRMKKDGLIVREEDYEFEDPFFGLWIRAL